MGGFELIVGQGRSALRASLAPGTASGTVLHQLATFRETARRTVLACCLSLEKHSRFGHGISGYPRASVGPVDLGPSLRYQRAAG